MKKVNVVIVVLPWSLFSPFDVAGRRSLVANKVELLKTMLEVLLLLKIATALLKMPLRLLVETLGLTRM